MAFSVSSSVLFSCQTSAESTAQSHLADATTSDTIRHNRKKQSVANKLEFFNRLVYRSPRVKAVDASGNEEAKKLLAIIRSNYEKANTLFEAGDLDGSENLINQSFAAIPKVLKKVPDKAREEKQARQHYAGLHQRVKSFQRAFALVVAEKGVTVASLLDQSQMTQLVEQAKAYIRQSRYREANQSMAEAANMIEQALIKAREKETLFYYYEFVSPEAEYKHELQRNKDYALLAKQLMEKYPVEYAKRIPRIRHLIKRSEELSSEARLLQVAGKPQEAAKRLEKGTQSLIRALRLGGLPL